MKEYLCEFFRKFSYPEEACTVLKQAYDTIQSDSSLKAEFERLLRCYADDMNYEFKKLLEDMAALSAKAGIHKYTGHLLLLVCMSKELKQYYAADEVDEQIWFTTMCDLKYKLIECKSVYDVWGTFVPGWFDLFFNMTRFGFERLQFETQRFEGSYEKDGVVLTPDSIVLNTHIPRTGTKLDRESVAASYARAAEFFSKRFHITTPVFVCHSWLLFPRNKEVLAPNSNLYAFMSDFDIVEQGEYDGYAEVWRLFDVNYNGNVEDLPQDTSLRRAYADWIRKGEKTGWGYGVYVYPAR